MQIDLSPVTGKVTKTLPLSKFLYIPVAGMKFISFAQLDAKLISSIIKNCVCKLIDRERSRYQIGFATGRNSENLYFLKVTYTCMQKVCYLLEKSGTNRTQTSCNCDNKDWATSRRLELRWWRAGSRIVSILINNPKIIDCVSSIESKQTKSRSDGALTNGNIHHTIHMNVIGPV